MAGHTRTFSPRDRKTYKKTKLLCGVGLNDADYLVSREKVVMQEDGTKKRVRVWTCPFYAAWGNMLKRCYSPAFQKKSPTYVGCSVCEEWLTFSNFKAWMEKQDYEGKELDKDLLLFGNKIYSPTTCVFVDQRVNAFILESTKNRGEWPIGVSLRKDYNKFTAQCWSIEEPRRLAKLGVFDTPEEAHLTWLAFKLEQAKILASEQTDPRVAKALVERYENYRE